jgi:hypothetical protein
MATEYIVSDPIVACLTIKAPDPPAANPGEPWFRIVSKILRKVCLPHEGATTFFEGRAYCPVYPNNRDPKTGCSWIETEDGGGYGQVVLAWAEQPKMWVRVTIKLRVDKYGHCAWLTVTHNPTSLTVGNNVHPAGFLDPRTGVADLWPSSSWPAMTRAFRLGFAFLAALSPPAVLFDPPTQLAIERGDFHLVSVQYAATKAVTNVSDFLQKGTVIYGQTIARGRGIINNAKHLDLRFKPYVDEDSPDNRVSGFMLQKLHGKKLHVSVSFYDKLVSLQEKHQETTLSLAEAQTVDQSVREDITAHSSFVLRIVAAAREKLANMSAAGRKFFARISSDEFLRGAPTDSVWWLQRAIYVLSHWWENGRWVRYSFGTWLVPFVEQEVLHLDVVAGITTVGYHALLALKDKVAVAWRSDPTPGASDWAGRLARIAGCTRSTVYNRREEWWQLYGIDIAYPLQMYSDILYFGHNSMAQPESITALLVAVDRKEGDEAVRLHAEALAHFEQKRVEIVNPALVSRPRAIQLRLPFVTPPDLDDFDDLPPDFDELGLDEVAPASPGLAKPNTAPASAKSGSRKLRRLTSRIGPAQPPPAEKKTVVKRLWSKPPPQPAEPKRIILRVWASRPPAERKKIILRVRRKTGAPPDREKEDRLARLRRSPRSPRSTPRGFFFPRIDGPKLARQNGDRLWRHATPMKASLGATEPSNRLPGRRQRPEGFR